MLTVVLPDGTRVPADSIPKRPKAGCWIPAADGVEAHWEHDDLPLVTNTDTLVGTVCRRCGTRQAATSKSTPLYF